MTTIRDRLLKKMQRQIAESTTDDLEKTIGLTRFHLALLVNDKHITQEDADEVIRSGSELCLLAARRTKPEKEKRKPRLSMKPEAESIGPDGVQTKQNIVLIPGKHTTSDGELVEIGMARFTNAVLAKIPEGTLYQRAGILGQVQDGKFHPISPSALRFIIDNSLRLASWHRDRESQAQVLDFEHCIADWAGVVHSMAGRHAQTRELRLIVNHPVCTADGVSPPGYHKGIYHHGEVIIPNMDIAACSAILDDLVIDFPFAERADKHNYFGLLVTPFLRLLIDGPVPMHMIMSSIERTGKTKLVDDVFGRIVLGGPCPAMQLSASDEERDKRFTALLSRCAEAVHFDNLNDFIDSAALCSFITARTYSGRVLGRSEITDFPQDLTIIGTANNPKGTGEIVKRCVPIVLRPDREDPQNRSEFAHPDLAAYVAENRQRILGVLLGLCLHGLQNRRRYIFGGFESWASLVGSVAHVAGWEAWRTNAEAWSVEADQETLDLRAFVDAWLKKLGICSVPLSLLHPVARDANVFPKVFSKPTERGQLTSLGFLLAKHVNRPVFRHRIGRSMQGNNALYYLEPLKGPEGPGEVPEENTEYL
jgi:hypothetical protein